MTSSPTANYDRLKLDGFNDNRRITTEGGIGTSALVIMMVYLLYEAVNAPAASAQEDPTMQSIGVRSVNLGSSSQDWQTARMSGLSSTKSEISIQPIAGDGLSSFVNSGQESTQSSISSASADQQPRQLSAFSSTDDSSGETSPNSSRFIFSPVNPSFAVSSLPLSSHYFARESSLSPLDGLSGENRSTSDRSEIPKVNTYKVIAVLNTDPEVIASSIEDAASADNSGLQVGINRAVILSKGTADQIAAFSERLLSTSAHSLQDLSIITQNLEHFGIIHSEVNPSGIGAVLYVSVDELLTISQEAGTTLFTAVNQEQAGVCESFINMTDFSDYIRVESVSDIKFFGASGGDDWVQEISMNNVGLDGIRLLGSEVVSELKSNPTNQPQITLTSAKESFVPASDLCEIAKSNAIAVAEGITEFDVPPLSQSLNQVVETDPLQAAASSSASQAFEMSSGEPSISGSNQGVDAYMLTTINADEAKAENLHTLRADLSLPRDVAPLIDSDSPPFRAHLGNGNNQMDVNVTVGFNSSWAALANDQDCGALDCDPSTPNNKSVLRINAVAAQDYEITSGSGSDSFQLQAKINPSFIEEWTDEMEKIALQEKSISFDALSMNRSSLLTGEGDDAALLQGDVRSSLINLGGGNDSVEIDGGIKNSFIAMGDGNDVALLIEPPMLTGMLLGGDGLDALRFDGSDQSVTIDLNQHCALIGSVNPRDHTLHLESIEIGVGGSANDVLVAGEETVWLDGAAGNDTYILSSNGFDNENAILGLNLTLEQLLGNDDQLVRWDQEANTLHKQHAFLVTSETGIPSDYVDGAELLPIGELNDVVLQFGISDGVSGLFEGATFSPWGIIADGGDGRDGNALILRNASTSTDYLQLASLAVSSQPEGDTSSVSV